MVFLSDFGEILIFRRGFGNLFVFIELVVFLVIFLVRVEWFAGFFLFLVRIFCDFFGLVVVVVIFLVGQIVGFESFKGDFGEDIVTGVGVEGDIVFDEKLKEFGLVVFI